MLRLKFACATTSGQLCQSGKCVRFWGVTPAGSVRRGETRIEALRTLPFALNPFGRRVQTTRWEIVVMVSSYANAEQY